MSMNVTTTPAGSTRRGPVGIPRLLPPSGTGPGLGEHLALHGPVPYRGRSRELIDTVEAAGLTGRGGGAFPTARKMRAVASGSRPVVVANCAEGEPAAMKDKALLSHAPHLVLDGLQLAAEAVGAREAYLYLHRSSALVRAVDRALAERAARRTDQVSVTVVTAPDRFLAGEESALVSRIEGGPAVPRFTPPRVFESGVRGRPTLVQNAETLAHLALIARYGAAWFRELGTVDEPGTMLATVHRAGRPSQVMEASVGTPLQALVGAGEDGARALLVGGYHGTWVPMDRAQGLRLLNADLHPHGAATGAGVLAVLPPDRCGLAESSRVVTYLALESAGQCGPCLNGLPRIAAAFERLAAPGPSRQVVDDVRRWAGLIERRGACHHPDGSVRFVRSALAVFADELAAHASGRCTATSLRPFLPTTQSGADEESWS